MLFAHLKQVIITAWYLYSLLQQCLSRVKVTWNTWPFWKNEQVRFTWQQITPSLNVLFDQVSALGRKLTCNSTVLQPNTTHPIRAFFIVNYISNKNVSSHIMIQNLAVKTVTIISSFGSIFRYWCCYFV